MVKHIQKNQRLLLTDCLSVFDHFVRLRLQGLKKVAVRENFYCFLFDAVLSKNIYKKFQLVPRYISKKSPNQMKNWLKNTKECYRISVSFPGAIVQKITLAL